MLLSAVRAEGTRPLQRHHLSRVSTGADVTRCHSTRRRWSQAPGKHHMRAGVRQEERTSHSRLKTLLGAQNRTSDRRPTKPRAPSECRGTRSQNARETQNRWWRKRGCAAGYRQSSRDDPRGADRVHHWTDRNRCERRALQACTLATLPTGKPSSPLAAHETRAMLPKRRLESQPRERFQSWDPAPKETGPHRRGARRRASCGRTASGEAPATAPHAHTARSKTREARPRRDDQTRGWVGRAAALRPRTSRPLTSPPAPREGTRANP